MALSGSRKCAEGLDAGSRVPKQRCSCVAVILARSMPQSMSFFSRAAAVRKLTSLAPQAARQRA